MKDENKPIVLLESEPDPPQKQYNTRQPNLLIHRQQQTSVPHQCTTLAILRLKMKRCESMTQHIGHHKRWTTDVEARPKVMTTSKLQSHDMSEGQDEGAVQ